MSTMSNKEMRWRRHRRLRRNVSGTKDVPRMSVCCTGRHMYVQFVDDVQQHTLAAVSTLDRAFRDGEHVRCDVKGAEVLGRLAAERALAAQIKKVVFDRGGFRYHGRVKALAEAARQGGLEF